MAKPCRYVLKFVWLPASTTLWLCSLLCDSDTTRSYENQIEKEVESFHHSVHLTIIFFQKQPSVDYQQWYSQIRTLFRVCQAVHFRFSLKCKQCHTSMYLVSRAKTRTTIGFCEECMWSTSSDNACVCLHVSIHQFIVCREVCPSFRDSQILVFKDHGICW